jgi:hypothetical protein
MLQIIYALVAIGLALALWQIFPAFKWVLLGLLMIPAIFVFSQLNYNNENSQIALALFLAFLVLVGWAIYSRYFEKG